MLDKIRQTVQKYGMLKGGEHVVVAVSGGPDSVALLQVLTLLSSEFDLTLTVAHLNHGLRGAESDAEEQLVCRLSEERGISCVVKEVNLTALREKEKRRRSLEDIGREERYSFFSTLAKEIGATRITLGHHREDQAETVLMNLIRGTGLEGMKGILPVRDGIFIRPLLEVCRKEILEFLHAEEIPFLEDSSNREDQFLRNRIRLHLIPLLQERYNPKIVDILNRTACIARREVDCLKSRASQILDDWQIPPQIKDGVATLEIKEFLKLHEALQYRVIKTLLGRMYSLNCRVTSAHIQAVVELCHGRNPDGILHMPDKILVKREYGQLTFVCRGDKGIPLDDYAGEGRSCEEFFYFVKIPDSVELKELGIVVKTAFAEKDEERIFGEGNNVAYLDFDKLKMPLVIRNRRKGDRFQPLGMEGTKKLKAYFIDEKIPRQKRDSIPLLADGHSVVWIAGLRTSERTRVNKETVHIVKIEII
ncbi:tRNA(Ile)-lysidine synthase [Syntrophus gentianae]|uniref:tRNA(Ile)-lysidine synthase n=1 Tax=Syntrophus gentianae TaxID=43775 RepID=A0A1H7XBX1_9BACT|nr:tRNA lysidine(34) synthetase TilS [Syntrophus gentianae]SEM31316.1 tRNA(Ile)-lysidine synthase [Syntrophus gentianae]